MPTRKRLKGTYEIDEESGQIVQPSVGSRVLNVLTLGHGGQRPVGRANIELAGEQIRDDRRYRQNIGEIRERQSSRTGEIDALRESRLKELKGEFDFRQGEVAKALERYIPDETTRNQVLGSVLAAPYFTAAKENVGTQATTARAAEEALAKQSENIAGSEAGELANLRKGDYERGLGKNAEVAGVATGEAQVEAAAAQQKKDEILRKTANIQSQFAEKAEQGRQFAEQQNREQEEALRNTRAQTEKMLAESLLSKASNQLTSVRDPEVIKNELRRTQGLEPKVVPENSLLINQPLATNMPSIIGPSKSSQSSYNRLTGERTDVVTPVAPSEINLTPLPIGRLQGTNGPAAFFTTDPSTGVTVQAGGALDRSSNKLILSDPTNPNLIPAESAAELVRRLREAKRVNPYQQ